MHTHYRARPIILALALAFTLGFQFRSQAAQNEAKPNILWLVAEDINANLGCYGDPYAVTPNLDRLAAKSLVYLNNWSDAPVCAPARTSLISGVYPPSSGGEHMRSMVSMPPFMNMYPVYLREAGYYCSNNAKTDYNVRTMGKPALPWDESSGQAHYNKRRPGQPFMAVFNHEITHESRIRTRPHPWVHDPAKAPLPPYHPDTLEVRQDWAQYYDRITEMDAQIGKKLQELEAAGLANDTIVFFYGDNGSGMPRHKRWPYNSGLRVPLIVHIPEKFRSLAPKEYQAGGKTDRLVSFVDYAPTLLSLAGVKPPEHLQGYAFLGKHEAPPREYVHGFRGRMDERYDMVRSVRDKRYIYVRHYMPHEIFGQYIAYMFQTPTTQVWKKLFEEGKLNAVQSRFWKTKEPEELYDLQTDPGEANNLANSPQHQEILQRLRKAQQEQVLRIRDVGFLPEDEIHSRARGSTPYDVAHDETKYPLKKILAAAELASRLKPEAVPQLKQALSDADSAVRYWGAMGFLMRGEAAVAAGRPELVKALSDAAPAVRIVAAEALGRFGTPADQKPALDTLLELAPQAKNGPYVSIAALNALEQLGPKAAPGLEIIKTAAAGGAAKGKKKAKDKTGESTETTNDEGRASGYSGTLVKKITADLERK